jgi:hypothetical protein
MCRDSIISIATRYKLVWGSNSSGGKIFRTCPDWSWDLTSLLWSVYQVSFLGVKRPGHDADHPPTYSAEVKERVEQYLYSPSGPSWPVLGWTFIFTFTLSSVNVNVCKCSYIMISRLNYAASSCVVDGFRGKYNVQCLTLQLVCSIAWWLYCRITKHKVFVVLGPSVVQW